MTHPPRDRQAGFTLIEILIVVAIVGVLIALALPAVQAAREASRRAQCLSTMRQHGIAVHADQSAAESFPIGCTTWNFGQAQVAPGWAWSSAILPQLEQPALYSSLNMDLAVDATENFTARSATLASFTCPSDLRVGSFQAASVLLGGIVESATTSYAASHGTTASGIGNGMFGVNKSVKVRDVKDGLSTTLTLGERGCLSVQNAWSGALSDGRGDAQILATTSAAAPAFDAGQPSSFFGPHAGVVLFLMGDGSARGISTSINPAILQALSTRNGRETVGAADF